MGWEKLDVKTRIGLSVACFMLAFILVIAIAVLVTAPRETKVENSNRVYVTSDGLNGVYTSGQMPQSSGVLPQSLQDQRTAQGTSPAQSLQGQRVQQFTGEIPPLTSVTINNHIPSASYPRYYPRYVYYPRYYFYPYHSRYYSYGGYHYPRYGSYY